MRQIVFSGLALYLPLQTRKLLAPRKRRDNEAWCPHAQKQLSLFCELENETQRLSNFYSTSDAKRKNKQLFSGAGEDADAVLALLSTRSAGGSRCWRSKA